MLLNYDSQYSQTSWPRTTKSVKSNSQVIKILPFAHRKKMAATWKIDSIFVNTVIKNQEKNKGGWETKLTQRGPN